MVARLRPSHAWFEPALAGVLAVLAIVEVAVYGHLDRPSDAIVAVLPALPVAIRFRAPLVAVTFNGAAAVLENAQLDHTGQAMLPTVSALLCLYAVGSTCRGWRFWVGGAIAGGLAAAAMVVREGVTSDLVLAVGLAGAGLLIGRALSVLQIETDVLEERANVLEQDRDEHTRLALHSERSRIARELHDVIGHSISVMGVQAGAVRSVLEPGQRREREALLAVERAGREAVGEMRRLIGLLRTEADGDAGPSPSLSRLDGLASDMRAAGQRLELEVDGDLAALPPGVDLAGYRIVQEALTNAFKHARGAQVIARVRLAGRILEVEVENDGAGASEAGNGRVGHGLLGMRERAVLYGGEVTARRRPGGGFRVHARLPVETG